MHDTTHECELNLPYHLSRAHTKIQFLSPNFFSVKILYYKVSFNSTYESYFSKFVFEERSFQPIFRHKYPKKGNLLFVTQL